MPSKYGVPRYVDGVRNPEYDRLERRANATQKALYNRRWRAANPDKVRKYRKRWLRKNLAVRRAYHREWRRRWRKKHPERAYSAHRCVLLRLNYGMNLESYLKLLEAQGKVCAICGAAHEEKPRKRLCVDHDHKTGKIRELLYIRCNTILGRVGDDPFLLRKAAEYVERHSL